MKTMFIDEKELVQAINIKNYEEAFTNWLCKKITFSCYEYTTSVDKDGYVRGSADLLFESTDKTIAVIIEAKNKKATMHVVPQVLRYLNDLRKKYNECYACILAPSISWDLEEYLLYTTDNVIATVFHEDGTVSGYGQKGN